MDAMELYHALLGAYGTPRWWSDDPYTVMVQAVLVQNTSWRNVEKAYGEAGGRLRPEYVLATSAEELEALIRPCGFQKAKARTIMALTAWYGSHGFDAASIRSKPQEDIRGELLSIKGIGEETADVILLYALRRPVFVVDAYTRRLMSRLGLPSEDDSDIRAFFETGLNGDVDALGEMHRLILEHGIAHCRKTPRCNACPLKSFCHLGHAASNPS